MSPLTAHRQLFDVGLEPVTGSRFQPTGFPDIGAALFERPVRSNGTVRWLPALLLESAQSIANRLEDAGWDRVRQAPVDTVAGLPHVRVVAAGDGRYLTSSRTEAHRLASAFVKDSTLDGRAMVEVIRERLGLRSDTPLAPRDIAGQVFALDPLCLIHGVFFADDRWPGQPRIARALTGFVEAIDVRAAVSGGVKRDDVRHQLEKEGAGTAEGYGFVPFHRTEYTAATITASFAIDLAQLAAYGLEPRATELLEALCRWEIRALLDGGLRFRTACDLVPTDVTISDRAGAPLGSLDELAAKVTAGVERCRDLFDQEIPLTVEWSPGGKREKRGSASA